MWLNAILLTAGILLIGIILGVVLSRPRRWDSYVCDDITKPCGHRRAYAPVDDDQIVAGSWQRVTPGV